MEARLLASLYMGWVELWRLEQTSFVGSGDPLVVHREKTTLLIRGGCSVITRTNTSAAGTDGLLAINVHEIAQFIPVFME